MKRILAVDDDRSVLMSLGGLLEQAGYAVTETSDPGSVRARLEAEWFDLVLTDLRMPGLDGMQLLDTLAALDEPPPVVMLTAHGTLEVAVEAMRRGAVDFLEKPFSREELLGVVERALARGREPGTKSAAPAKDAPTILGVSAEMQEVLRLVERAAGSRSRVLVRGESGTGKELVARRVHDLSARAAAPYVAVNCAALPDSLLEAEMFGFEKGAFTGAAQARPGRVELADGGTLFLDEIGDLGPSAQAKLLRFLEDGSYERLGSGGATLRSDVRVVAATWRDLAAMAEEGEFREDLYYRLAVLEIVIPPLRTRPSDVAVLARHFFEEVKALEGRPELCLEDDAIEALARLPWLGNARELRNFVERLVVYADGRSIDAEAVEARSEGTVRSSPSGPTAPSAGLASEQLTQARAQMLDDALERAKGNKARAARLLGVSRRTLYRWLDERESAAS